MKNVLLILGLLCLLGILGGCGKLEARDEAESGRDALLNCSFINGYAHFQNAYRLYDQNRDIIIGLAISELAVYADSQKIQSVLSRFGSNKNLNQVCRDHAENNDEFDKNEKNCLNFELHNLCSNKKIENTWLSEQNLAKIDPTLTWRNVTDALYENNELLLDAARHFYQAADNMDLSDVWHIEFSGQKLTFHKTDFAALSFALYIASFCIDILAQYDLNFSVQKTLTALHNEDEKTLADLLNKNLGIPAKTSNVSYQPDKTYRSFISALQSLKLAVDGMIYIYEQNELENFVKVDDNGCRQHPALFYWELMYYGIIDDLGRLSAIDEISNGVLDLKDFIAPNTTFNLSTFLHNLPVQSGSDTIIDVDSHGAFQLHFQNIIRQFNTNFTPQLFDAEKGDFSLANQMNYRLNSAWLKWKPIKLICEN